MSRFSLNWVSVGMGMQIEDMAVDEIIRHLDLKPHPEGGHFRETFRDPHRPDGVRAVSTAIYFLLRAGEVSRWHRIDSAEAWHWYAGAPLQLSLKTSLDGPAQLICLGNRLLAGETPQAVVPAEVWQQAKSLGDWTLVGCTVAPGFMFDRFEMAPSNRV